MSVQHRRAHAQRGRGASADELQALVRPVVEAAGFDLEGVDVKPAGRRRVVRVVVDADGGVDLDDVATLSRSVSSALDRADALGTGPYVLEVTSPGVDRPLTEPRHWRRAAGRLVRAPLTAGGEIEGRVVSADGEAVVLDVAGVRRRFGLTELGRGRVQVEFRRPEPDQRPDQGPDEGGASWTST